MEQEFKFGINANVLVELIDTNGKTVTLSFPKPYYKTVRNKAIAIYGNYIDDLFKLKREGVLKARGVF